MWGVWSRDGSVSLWDLRAGHWGEMNGGGIGVTCLSGRKVGALLPWRVGPELL